MGRHRVGFFDEDLTARQMVLPEEINTVRYGAPPARRIRLSFPSAGAGLRIVSTYLRDKGEL